MKVLLLAAGRSRRIKPIEDKNFVEFLGKPLIEHQIRQLAAVGLKEIIVVGGPHNIDRLRKLAKSLPYKIQVIEQKILPEIQGGGVLAAEKYIKNGQVLIVSAQDVVEPDAYRMALEAVRAHGSSVDGFLVAKKVHSYFPGGYLKIKNGFITGIVEKPGAGREPSNMVNLVIHYHRDGRSLLEAIKSLSKSLQDQRSARADLYEAALDHMIKSGTKIKALPYSGFWQAIKYPWHVLDVMERFLSESFSKASEGKLPFRHNGAPTPGAFMTTSLQKLKVDVSSPKKHHIVQKNVEIAKSATIRGEVYLDEGVRVLDNAVIVGPAFIGKNTVVATNALVRESHIGADCVIGFGTEIARSYLGNHVWTHTNYIGDSIIGNDVSFGAGTVTGNLRLDEGSIAMNISSGSADQPVKIDSGRTKLGLVTGDHIRCGINASFMPGVKIGNNCFIGAGIVIGQDIPDGQLVYARTELMIKENKHHSAIRKSLL